MQLGVSSPHDDATKSDKKGINKLLRVFSHKNSGKTTRNTSIRRKLVAGRKSTGKVDGFKDKIRINLHHRGSRSSVNNGSDSDTCISSDRKSESDGNSDRGESDTRSGVGGNSFDDQTYYNKISDVFETKSLRFDSSFNICDLREVEDRIPNLRTSRLLDCDAYYSQFLICKPYLTYISNLKTSEHIPSEAHGFSSTISAKWNEVLGFLKNLSKTAEQDKTPSNLKYLSCLFSGFNSADSSVEDHFLESVVECHNKTNKTWRFSNEYLYMFHMMNSYVDLHYYNQHHHNGDLVRCLYMLHVSNHVLRHRQRIWKNGELIRKIAEEYTKSNRKRHSIDALDVSSVTSSSTFEPCWSPPTNLPSATTRLNSPLCEDEHRFADQGLNRPAVLILSPFRSIAKIQILTLGYLLPTAKQIAKKQRFLREFDVPIKDEGFKKMEQRLLHSKPPDYSHLLRGNIDDNYCIGVQVNESKLHLYTPLLESDIIFASPGGLRNKLRKGRHCPETIFSSIELLVIDRADVIKFQNWDDVKYILKFVNKKPRDVNTDIRRIRKFHTDNRSRILRQTLVFSLGNSIDYQCLLESDGEFNYRGAARIWPKCSDESSFVHLYREKGYRQLFCSVPINSLSSILEEKWKFFKLEIYPRHIFDMVGLLVVIPSMVELVGYRQVLSALNVQYDVCDEDPLKSKGVCQKALRRFANGGCQLLLITERYLFFRRPQIKGVRNLVFVSPPEVPSIYSYLLSMCKSVSSPTDLSKPLAVCYISHYDCMALERIAGYGRTSKLIETMQLSGV